MCRCAARRVEHTAGPAALGQLDEAEVDRAVHRIVDKLLHQPTVRAKELAIDGRFGEYEDALRQLFDLHAEGSGL